MGRSGGMAATALKAATRQKAAAGPHERLHAPSLPQAPRLLPVDAMEARGGHGAAKRGGSPALEASKASPSQAERVANRARRRAGVARRDRMAVRRR